MSVGARRLGEPQLRQEFLRRALRGVQVEPVLDVVPQNAADPLVEFLDLALLDEILRHQGPQAGIGQFVGRLEDPHQLLGPSAA